jgi:hypothetical protein
MSWFYGLALMEAASFCAMKWNKRYSVQQETAPKIISKILKIAARKNVVVNNLRMLKINLT